MRLAEHVDSVMNLGRSANVLAILAATETGYVSGRAQAAMIWVGHTSGLDAAKAGAALLGRSGRAWYEITGTVEPHQWIYADSQPSSAGPVLTALCGADQTMRGLCRPLQPCVKCRPHMRVKSSSRFRPSNEAEKPLARRRPGRECRKADRRLAYRPSDIHLAYTFLFSQVTAHVCGHWPKLGMQLASSYRAKSNWSFAQARGSF
jgi:hypothetical protein